MRLPALLLVLLVLFATTGLSAATVTVQGESFKELSYQEYVTPKGGQWFAFEGVNFTGATAIVLRAARQGAATMEFRLDSPTGTKVGQVTVNTGGWRTFQNHTATLGGVSGGHKLYVVATGDGSTAQAVCHTIAVTGTSFSAQALYCDDMAPALRNSDYYFVSLQNAWAKYPAVDLAGGISAVRGSIANGTTGTLTLRRDSTTGPVIATWSVPNTGWRTFTTQIGNLTGTHSGVHDLYLVGSGAHGGVIDRFELDVTATGGGGGTPPVTLPPATAPSDGTLFVSPLGSDSNNGSWASPFLTIQKAATVANPGAVIYIRQGTYREEVRPARSGTSENPIIFKGMPNETAVVSGANVVNGGWSLHSGNIYKTAAMDWDLGRGANQIFVDGAAMIEARYPNATDGNPSYPGWQTNASASGVGTSNVSLTSNALSGNWTGAGVYIHLYHGYPQTGVVTSSSGSTQQVLMDTPWSAALGTPQFYLYGHLNALDVDKEWVRTGGQLYLRMPGGGNPTGHVVEAKVREYAFNLTNRSYITVQNLRIVAATISTRTGRVATNASTWASSSTGVLLENLDCYQIRHFLTLPGANMWVPRYMDEQGIDISGTRNEIRNSVIDGSAASGVYLGEGFAQRVLGNTIRNVGYGMSGSGVQCGTSDGDDGSNLSSQFGEVAYNTIDIYGKVGITFAGLRGGRIHHNRLTNGMLQLADGGAFYGWGTDGNGVEIDYNYVRSQNLSSITGSKVALYADNRMRSLIMHHNDVGQVEVGMILNTPSQGRPQDGQYRRIYNNSSSANTAFNQPYPIEAVDWGETFAGGNNFTISGNGAPIAYSPYGGTGSGAFNAGQAFAASAADGADVVRSEVAINATATGTMKVTASNTIAVSFPISGLNGRSVIAARLETTLASHGQLKVLEVRSAANANNYAIPTVGCRSLPIFDTEYASSTSTVSMLGLPGMRYDVGLDRRSVPADGSTLSLVLRAKAGGNTAVFTPGMRLVLTVVGAATPPTNAAPTVSAGLDRGITLPVTASLDGTVMDDGLPTGASVTTTWSKVSGPGIVTFANAAAVDTSANFSAAGTYVLRLTASDTALSASDEVTVIVTGAVVNAPPNVNAGPDGAVTLPASASLTGTVSDDGLPSGSVITTTWTKVSGPGTVTFGSAAAVDTTATFSVAGTYVLTLTVSDGSLNANDTVTITVASTPAPGVTRTIRLRRVDGDGNALILGASLEDQTPSENVAGWREFSGLPVSESATIILTDGNVGN